MIRTHAPPGLSRRRWAILLAYSLLILGTLSLVRAARDELTARLGQRGFDWCVWGLFALAAAALFSWAIRQRALRSPRRLVALALACGVYAVMILRLEVAVERIHYLEYGLVAVLALRAFEVRTPDAAAYVLACLYVMALGLLDETIQWILPTRVGEFRDVAINLSAGALGLAPVAAAREHPFVRPSGTSWARAMRWAAGIMAQTAVFLTFIHGFGFLHASSDHAKFRSVFARGGFDTYGRAAESVAYREFPDSPVAQPGEGLVGWIRQRFTQWRLLRHPSAEAYNYEAWRHRQLRDAFETPRYAQFREAAEEDLILSSFFSAYPARYAVAWPAEQRLTYGAVSYKRGTSYVSPAQELLITWVRPPVFWAASGVCVGALLFLSFLVEKPRSAAVGSPEPVSPTTCRSRPYH